MKNILYLLFVIPVLSFAQSPVQRPQNRPVFSRDTSYLIERDTALIFVTERTSKGRDGVLRREIFERSASTADTLSINKITAPLYAGIETQKAAIKTAQANIKALQDQILAANKDYKSAVKNRKEREKEGQGKKKEPDPAPTQNPPAKPKKKKKG